MGSGVDLFVTEHVSCYLQLNGCLRISRIFVDLRLGEAHKPEIGSWWLCDRCIQTYKLEYRFQWSNNDWKYATLVICMCISVTNVLNRFNWNNNAWGYAKVKFTCTFCQIIFVTYSNTWQCIFQIPDND